MSKQANISGVSKIGINNGVLTRISGCLALEDGSILGFAPAALSTSKIVTLFTRTMNLKSGLCPTHIVLVHPEEKVVERLPANSIKESVPRVDDPSRERKLSLGEWHHPWVGNLSANGNIFHCYVDVQAEEDKIVQELMRISMAFGLCDPYNSVLFIHAALVERNGRGILLAGASGAGKTTATGRMPPPWRVLSDDVSFIVKDSQGCYWVHAWPTWSMFTDGGQGGTWDVSLGIRLDGIFLLSQGSRDKATSMGRGEAICSLLESVNQASHLMTIMMNQEEQRKLRLKWFDQVYELTESVSSYHLSHSRHGAFWQEIERTCHPGPS